MKTIILIGCGKKKASSKCEAQFMYQGDLFKKAFAYAQKLGPDKIYILSAKYHVLELNKIIVPYNETLNGKKVEEIKNWSQEVLTELKNKGHDLLNDKFIFLSGKNYYKYLLPEIKVFEVPYSRYNGIGYILQFLNNQLKS